MPGPIKISIIGDTSDLNRNLGNSEKAMNSAADTAQKAASKIDSSFGSTAEGADNVASKGSQAAGALAGLGSLGVLAGGSIGKIGAGAVIAGTGVQALADAGDLLNVVTESQIVKSTLAKGATIGKAIAEKAAAGASKAYAAAQWAVNAAMEANPIALVVIALVALVAAVVIAYKKSETFRKIVNGAFGAVRKVAAGFASFFTKTIPGAVGKVVGWVKAHWPVILAIMTGPIGLIVLAVTRNLDKIKGAFSDVIDWIRDVPGKIGALVGRFADAGGKLAGGLVNGLKGIGGSVGDIGRSIVNSVIGFLNDVLPHSLTINKGPIHVSVPLFPTIPALASGGITTGPMLALIGDNPGGREAVIPLDKFDMFGRHVTYNVNLSVPVTASAYDIGETLVGFIREYEEQGGQ